MKRFVRKVVYQGLRITGLIEVQRVLRLRRDKSWASGLVFHRVSNTLPEDGLTISPERFDAILGMLTKRYQVLSVDEMADLVDASGPFTGREVVITFDDGYLDNYELAAPILESHGLPACFFLTAGYVGTERDFPWDVDRGVPSHLMTWAQARDLVERGFDVGCHTWSHPDLGREPISSAEQELVCARAFTEERVGCPVLHFAYPFGGKQNIRPEWINAIKQAGFRTNWSADNGFITSTTERYYIPRIGAAPQRSLSELGIDLDAPW